MHSKMLSMAKVANTSSLEIPRLCGRQTEHNNVQAATTKEYFKKAISILDFIIQQQFNVRFGHLMQHAIQALYLIPSNCAAADVVLDYCREDLPSPDTFHQEIKIWQAVIFLR